MANKNPTPLYLLPGHEAITAEGLSKMCEALTGREFAPEEMAMVRKRLKRAAAQYAAKQRN
jgi:hypothetical protein